MSKKKTFAFQEHCVYNVGYYFKCTFDDSKSYYASSGNTSDDCITWFVNQLRDIAINVSEMLEENEPMRELTKNELRMLKDPNAKCFICSSSFQLNEPRARDHCHFTGEFRGVTHMRCNLNYQESRTIPIVMHNLTGYDAHLFIKKLALEIDGDLSIIPINTEQYISFTKIVDESTNDMDHSEKIKLKFIDSFRFMPASLSKLASLIPSNEKRILHTECTKRKYSSMQISMLERKGVFPYEYIDSLDKLNETSLPAEKDFYSELNDEKISEKDYIFANSVWNSFKLDTLGDYSELYMMTDILLLADVFENFRNTCMRIYKLDPAHYYTSPGLSWDAMLKYTGVRIELQTDIDKLMFIESGIRGGITQCSKRYVKANNPYMGDMYDENELITYLMYLDGKLTFQTIFNTSFQLNFFLFHFDVISK